jgi:hypothetical protein
MNNFDISRALVKLGYTEFVVRGDTYEGIEWVEQPASIPSKEEVLAKVAELPAILEAEANAKATQKTAILERIGLTKEELQIVLGA